MGDREEKGDVSQTAVLSAGLYPAGAGKPLEYLKQRR